MLPNSSESSGKAARWLWILPFGAALVVHLGVLRSPLMLDDKVMVERLKEIPSLSPAPLFFENYVRVDRVDQGYRPLTFATHVSLAKLGPHESSTLVQRAANQLLHAMVAAAVFYLLVQLGAVPPIAALGSTIFAVSPIATDAVARIAGRAEILATLCALGAWMLALRNASSLKSSRSESPFGVALVGGLTLAALLSKENEAMLLPAALLLSAWMLGRELPWRSIGSSLAAVLGYLVFRSVVLEDRAGFSTLLMNPLRDAGLFQSITHASRHLFLHAFQTICPVRLSAEYTFLDVPTSGIARLVPSLLGLLTVLGTGVIVVARRKRFSLPGLGLASFFLLALPAAMILTPQRSTFAERNAYLPSVGLGIMVSGMAMYFVLRHRKRTLGALSVIILLFSARTAARNEDWASGDITRLAPARGDLNWPQDLLLAYTQLSNLAKGPLEVRELRTYMHEEADRILKESPQNGWGHAILGQELLDLGKSEEAFERMNQAISWLESQRPPILEPEVYRLRGEALAFLGRDAEAFEDLDRHIRLMKSAQRKVEAIVYSRHGLCLGRMGHLQKALESFNIAISIRKDLPEIWNNRGFARFKLDDYQGASTDYQAGLDLCRKSNTITKPDGHSVHSFLLKIADLYRSWGERLLAAGDPENAKKAEAEAHRFRSEAETLVPPAGAQKTK